MPDLQGTDYVGWWTKVLNRKECRGALARCQRDYPHSRAVVIPYIEVAKQGVEGVRCSEDIMDNPGKAIEDCRDAITGNHSIKDKDGKPVADIIPRFTGLPKKTLIKNIRQRHINKMVAIEVQVKRVSAILPRCIEAIFKCPAGHFSRKHQPLMKWVVPDGCMTDGCNFRKLDFVPLRSKFTDTQRIQVQEVLDNLNGGEQPQSLNAELMDDLVGRVFPGDRVIINAIVRSYQKITQSNPTPTFNIFLEVNSIEIFEREYEEVHISEEDEAAIVALSKFPNILERVAASISPTVHGFTDVKEAYALAMFSGRQSFNQRGDATRMDIHCLCVGDYGLAKTRVAKSVTRIVPRGVFVSGQSTSAAGLTVAVTKDEGGDGRWVAEAGAMCLADLGVIVIDELGKIPERDISALLEAMESQTVSIAKAGLVATLNTRCAVIACMNPKHGRFELTEDLADQIKVDPAVLSRFDLIFLKTDVPNEANDYNVAMAILDPKESSVEEIPLDVLRKYVAYSKKQPNPKVCAAAKEKMARYYVTIRSKAKAGQPIPLTARANEALWRISTAHAKMRLSKEVTVEDATLAIRILENSLKGVAWDEHSGTYDIDKISGGYSHSKRNLTDNIIHAMTQLGGDTTPVAFDRLMEEMDKRNVKDRLKVQKIFDGLLREGEMLDAGQGYYRLMVRR